ncbi:glycosyltransferase [Pelagibacteraceae bacterium]|jgi:dolichol-phosphate mannosyltransferase|nr:glycosyltransferase [Pelagibacteraceae bacterium]
MQYSVILPTLNENGHIESLILAIEKVLKFNKKVFEIIIIDDNSTDGTINTVKSLVQQNNNLKLNIRNNLKKNLAESINLGIRLAKYENIIWMDADFQHPPKYLQEFIKKTDQYDAIICSRFLTESERYFKDENLDKDINENQSYFFNQICKLLLYKDITDYTSGYICIKKKIFNNFKLSGFYGDYFVTLISYLKRNNFNIIEIPFKDEIRASGHSKTVINFNLKYTYTCLRYISTLIKNFTLKIFK